MEGEIELKRIYDLVDDTDGIRILVDRLWPRGISKEAAQIDYWLKEIAPSNELRKWFHHEVGKYEEFKEKYLEELTTDEDKKERVKELVQILRKGKVTFLYGAKDNKYNQAVILKEFILNESTRCKKDYM
ncbi:DUF488 domain-containing protein [Fredinandcohnia quinoae]|uniref:DUF488 domain-containing protein n=1 Tax=Fredinandcohnia quinoae TaxID=2918902 RepID=A0AAW5E4I1_9BACI|nr:DUF488 domain-containing protein [Fredinandcohnia sp. SECRCQ15]MCH1624251.1 DUF488 domain-containing protein [Fredinandcohnia sp. SECRCQ15]